MEIGRFYARDVKIIGTTTKKNRFKRCILHALNRIAELSACKMRRQLIALQCVIQRGCEVISG